MPHRGDQPRNDSAPSLVLGVGVAAGAPGVSHPEPCAGKVSVRAEGPVPPPPSHTHTHSPPVLERVVPAGAGLCLPLRPWVGWPVSVWGRLPPSPAVPARVLGAPLQMSLLPGAIYRVHFVHIQGLQSLLLVIKGKGEEAAAVLELKPALPLARARAGAGARPWPFAPFSWGTGRDS